MTAYYGQQQKEAGGQEADLPSEPVVKPVVPLKKELENASSVFAKYKSKISCFFEVTKKVEEKLSSKKNEATSSKDGSALKQLVTNYGDDDKESENEKEEEEDLDETSKKGEDKVKDNDGVEEVDTASDEDESDYEIVTTSELKQANERRNYLMPSLKASYFPLKASLTKLNEISKRSLIAVEKTKNAITFLGNGTNVQKQLKLNDILFS